MAIIQTLKDQSNNIIYPQTHIAAVLNSSGDTLDTILATKVSTNNVGQYLPPATASALGGVRVDGVTITATSDGIISAVPGLNIKVVQVLPTTGISTTTIYLLANGGTGTNIYDEYVYVNNKWEKIGTTDIDLSEYAKKTELPTSTSDLTNDSGYITKAVSNLENYTLTTALAVVALSGSYNDLNNKPTFATVATSGSYNDLSNKPTLATVATSGSYNDLSNKPTIPDISNLMVKTNPTYTGTLSGENGTFSGKVTVNASTTPTANQVRNVTCSTSEPTSADGQNGDLWIVYEEA